MELNAIESYFYNETKDFEIKSLTLAETKSSYLWTTKCYLIETKQGTDFYVFVSDTLPTNLYPIKDSESLIELYYKHIGLMTELCSDSIANNFVKDFIGNYSIFPILDRRFNEIANEIELNKNSNQLSGIANQIRDCYLALTDYLMNKVRTSNPEYKNSNFTANLEEFLKIIIPGSQSETRRNIINGIAQKGWKFNSELVHKDSVTVFDLLTSFNIIQLITSTISNLLVGNNMPFNKIKCPTCQSEEYSLSKNTEKEWNCICKNCQTHYSVPIDSIIRGSKMNSIQHYIDINLNDPPPRKKGKNASEKNYIIREKKAIVQANPIKTPNPFTVDKIINLVNNFLDVHGIIQGNKLNSKGDFLWLKFTTDKYLGVVASGCDFNFSDKFTSGLLITSVGKKWDTNSLAIFPLSYIPKPYKIKDIEKAIGNYLIENNVPIIDFYSHKY